MGSKPKIALAFDLYGTLLSTESISTKLAEYCGEEKAASISQQWRRYQLEYTWRINSMKNYVPFDRVTRNALTHALAEAGADLSSDAVDALMDQYNALSLYPDVPPLFLQLSKSGIFYPVVFSNGTPDMLSASITRSPEMAPHSNVFKGIISVDPTRKFKPATEAYNLLLGKILDSVKVGGRRDVWLVSGNPFDIVGALDSGLSACWVNRGRTRWVDACPYTPEGGHHTPDVIVNGVDEVPDAVERFCDQAS
ncbi:haloacid dehalogenase, type II [Sporormia fimetaria CBS 119925]|uniref:Haloacid dehalogenase, type II n=1 Tax=Sporormia fimetaria CBS 119925 TaxID=1340428 RepID=A0A6A6UZS2_9PLEO|nr:haloacid dehalogenase, type II [Sporormia fimetaria CBS 119925]